MLSKNELIPLKVNKKYTFSKNERTSFLDIISTGRGLTRKHKGSKIPNMLAASDHSYVLHGFKPNKTRRNLHNFKYSAKGMDLDNFILKFDQKYNNLFIESSNDEEAYGERFQKTVEKL